MENSLVLNDSELARMRSGMNGEFEITPKGSTVTVATTHFEFTARIIPTYRNNIQMANAGSNNADYLLMEYRNKLQPIIDHYFALANYDTYNLPAVMEQALDRLRHKLSSESGFNEDLLEDRIPILRRLKPSRLEF